MESDGEEEEENLPLVPTVQVTSALLSFAVSVLLPVEGITEHLLKYHQNF